MKIYTKAGGEGSTGRGDGVRVRKSDPLMASVGGTDETNAAIGLCLVACEGASSAEIHAALEPTQMELFRMGAVIAACGQGRGAACMVDESAVLRMEGQIDRLTAQMPPLEHFVLPRGTELACRLHVARTSCRRGERAIVAAADAGAQFDSLIFRYIDRLSDLLFALARFANYQGGVKDVQWP